MTALDAGLYLMMNGALPSSSLTGEAKKDETGLSRSSCGLYTGGPRGSGRHAAYSTPQNKRQNAKLDHTFGQARAGERWKRLARVVAHCWGARTRGNIMSSKGRS